MFFFLFFLLPGVRTNLCAPRTNLKGMFLLTSPRICAPLYKLHNEVFQLLLTVEVNISALYIKSSFPADSNNILSASFLLVRTANPTRISNTMLFLSLFSRPHSSDSVKPRVKDLPEWRQKRTIIHHRLKRRQSVYKPKPISLFSGL